MATIVTLPTFANQHEAIDRQSQFMAVYLLHFSNFIEWPDTSFQNKEDFNICIDGVTEVNKYIHEIEGENVKGKKIKIKPAISGADIQDCQILFVSRSGGFKLNRIKEQLQNKSILLVSDRQNFIHDGGMIEYYIEDNKLRIAISIDAARQKGLKISSKLLRIAKIIDTK